MSSTMMNHVALYFIRLKLNPAFIRVLNFFSSIWTYSSNLVSVFNLNFFSSSIFCSNMLEPLFNLSPIFMVSSSLDVNTKIYSFRPMMIVASCSLS